MILLPETGRSHAWRIAERLRNAVSAIHVEWAEELPQVTISLGVAVSSGNEGLPADILIRSLTMRSISLNSVAGTVQLSGKVACYSDRGAMYRIVPQKSPSHNSSGSTSGCPSCDPGKASPASVPQAGASDF
jgi:hypothetical protein